MAFAAQIELQRSTAAAKEAQRKREAAHGMFPFLPS
jgi:hypothetical protein